MMNCLSNPRKSLARLLIILLAMPLLFCYKKADGQYLPDSAFEKVTFSVLKKDDAESKMKDGQRLLFLSLSGFSSAEQKKLYYRYRDSLLITVKEDSTLKTESWKKLSRRFDSAGVSVQQSFSSAIDELITPRDTTTIQPGITIANDLKKDIEDLSAARNMLLYALLGVTLIAAFFIVLLFIRVRKASKRLEELEDANNQLIAVEPASKNDKDKKNKKLSDDLKKIKQEKKQLEEQKHILLNEKNVLEKEKEVLQKTTDAITKSFTELEDKHKTASSSLEKTEQERKKQEDISIRLQDDLNKLSAVHKEQDEQSKKLSGIINKLENVAKPTSFPDVNAQLHAWFLLQELIKGYKTKEFSVLSTPNFSKWILQQEHTYPELDVTNLAGNAPIINFLIDLKKRKLTKIAPDGSYLVLINQKVTQPIFDSLKSD